MADRYSKWLDFEFLDVQIQFLKDPGYPGTHIGQKIIFNRSEGVTAVT